MRNSITARDVTTVLSISWWQKYWKKWDCWIAWLLVNITQLILHISVGHVFMPIVCTLYLINGISALVGWMKLYRKKA